MNLGNIQSASTRIARATLLSVALVAVVSGCTTMKGLFGRKQVTEDNRPVATLYDKAHKSVMKGNYGTAEDDFKTLLAQYPYGPYAEQALMEMAYAQHKANANDDAVSSVDRFLRTYPTNRNVPYMYYLRGLANQARNTVFMARLFDIDMSSRDLAAPRQAYNDFGIVIDKYPNSRYAAEARERRAYLNNQFARYELSTAVHYLRNDAYVAAISRAKYLLENYPETEYRNDAVAVMAEAYTRLGNTQLAADSKRVLETNDPNHPWLNGKWPRGESIVRRLNPFARGGAVSVEHVPPPMQSAQ